jgi:hypothetical protein
LPDSQSDQTPPDRHPGEGRIQLDLLSKQIWIPAFAGMTIVVIDPDRSRKNQCAKLKD